MVQKSQKNKTKRALYMPCSSNYGVGVSLNVDQAINQARSLLSGPDRWALVFFLVFFCFFLGFARVSFDSPALLFLLPTFLVNYRPHQRNTVQLRPQSPSSSSESSVAATGIGSGIRSVDDDDDDDRDRRRLSG